MLVFNTGAPSNHPFKSAYRRHEKKRHQYEQHVCEVEHDRFTSFIFTTTGGMGDASQVYKRLANLLCDKLDLSCGEITGWIRCKLSFALVRSSIMCIRYALIYVEILNFIDQSDVNPLFRSDLDVVVLLKALFFRLWNG